MKIIYDKDRNRNNVRKAECFQIYPRASTFLIEGILNLSFSEIMSREILKFTFNLPLYKCFSWGCSVKLWKNSARCLVVDLPEKKLY